MFYGLFSSPRFHVFLHGIEGGCGIFAMPFAGIESPELQEIEGALQLLTGEKLGLPGGIFAGIQHPPAPR